MAPSSPLPMSRARPQVLGAPVPEFLVSAGGRESSAPRSLAEVDTSDYLDGDHGGSDPVDHEAERWPPASVCDELAAVLPEVLEPVGGEA